MKKKILLKILLFLFGYIVAFFINFTFKFQNNFLTHSITFYVYLIIGFLVSKKTSQIILLSGVLIHFTLILIFLRWTPQIYIIILIAFISLVIGVLLKKYFWNKKKILFYTLVIAISSINYFTLKFINLTYSLNKPANTERKIKGEIFPEISFLTKNKALVKSSDFKNKVIIIEIWHSTCTYCKYQFIEMEKLAKKLKRNKDVKFYFVNNAVVDDFEKFHIFVNTYTQSNNIEFLYDDKKKLANLFNTDSAPLTIIIDKQGNIQFTMIGFNKNLKKEIITTIENKIIELKADEQL